MATAKNTKPAVREIGVGIVPHNQPDMAQKIETNIKKLEGSEKITKATLSTLSRDCLEYIVLNGSTDVATVNRLLSVLTPVNKRAAIMFFAAFLPYKVDGEAEHVVGGKLKGDDRITKKVEATKAFLSDPKNDIWTWQAVSLKVESKDVDWGAIIERNVKTALEKGYEPYNVLVNCLNAGVTMEALMEMVKVKGEAIEAEGKRIAA